MWSPISTVFAFSWNASSCILVCTHIYPSILLCNVLCAPQAQNCCKKPETSKKTPALKYHWYFFDSFLSFFPYCVSFAKLRFVCCKIAFGLREIASVFTAYITVCPIFCTIIHYVSHDLHRMSVRYVCVTTGSESWHGRWTRGAKLFLSLSACIAQWTSCAMVVHVNLANRLEIYKGARITQRPLASWILLGCVNLCSKVNWEDVYVPGIYNTPLCLGRSGSRCQVGQVDTTLVPPLASFCINQQTSAQNNLFHKPASPPANVESDIFQVSID